MKYPVYIRGGSETTLPSNVRVADLAEIENNTLVDVAFWFIDMHRWQDGWRLLETIRRNPSPNVYLRPVVYLLDEMDFAAEIRQAADGMVSRDKLSGHLIESWISRLQPVNQWIDQLHDVETEADTNIAFKSLRIVASRAKPLEPIMTARRNSGFVYPLLEPLYGKRDTSVLEVLEFLANHKLLRGEFYSRAHFCSQCDSAFLNFMETCPQCNDQNIHAEELIHHFKCAYTAPITDFRQGSSLICPKCERELRHIGVDYDRPSMVYQCRSCSYTFQDPKIDTACYHCGRSTEPENQVIREIKRYSLSAIGENAAEFGMEVMFTSILESEMHLYTKSAFEDFLTIEKARIRRYRKSASSLVFIHFEDIDQLYIKLGARAREVFTELSAVFKSVLRETDVISARNESIFLIIMTETDVVNAATAVERLQIGIADLFRNNLQFIPKMSVKVYPIGDQEDLEPMLESFLTDAAA